MAKAAFWTVTDTEARKRGEQTGLDTLVVHAVNDGCSPYGGLKAFVGLSQRDKHPAWEVRAQA